MSVIDGPRRMIFGTRWPDAARARRLVLYRLVASRRRAERTFGQRIVRYTLTVEHPAYLHHQPHLMFEGWTA